MRITLARQVIGAQSTIVKVLNIKSRVASAVHFVLPSALALGLVLFLMHQPRIAALVISGVLALIFVGARFGWPRLVDACKRTIRPVVYAAALEAVGGKATSHAEQATNCAFSGGECTSNSGSSRSAEQRNRAHVAAHAAFAGV